MNNTFPYVLWLTHSPTILWYETRWSTANYNYLKSALILTPPDFLECIIPKDILGHIFRTVKILWSKVVKNNSVWGNSMVLRPYGTASEFLYCLTYLLKHCFKVIHLSWATIHFKIFRINRVIFFCKMNIIRSGWLGSWYDANQFTPRTPLRRHEIMIFQWWTREMFEIT